MTLRELREERGLTLAEVAKSVGTDVGNLSRIERGKQPPRTALAKRLARFYKTTLDVVFEQPQEPSSPRNNPEAGT